MAPPRAGRPVCTPAPKGQQGELPATQARGRAAPASSCEQCARWSAPKGQQGELPATQARGRAAPASSCELVVLACEYRAAKLGTAVVTEVGGSVHLSAQLEYMPLGRRVVHSVVLPKAACQMVARANLVRCEVFFGRQSSRIELSHSHEPCAEPIRELKGDGAPAPSTVYTRPEQRSKCGSFLAGESCAHSQRCSQRCSLSSRLGGQTSPGCVP